MSKFKLPEKIDHYLSVLTKRYQNNYNNRILAKLLVNSQIKILEGVHYDNYLEGIYSHEIILHIPENIFLDIMDRKNNIESQILSDLSTLSESIANEDVYSVKVDILDSEHNHDWREQSDMFVHNKKIKKAIPKKSLEHIWGNNANVLKIFISHRDNDKALAKTIAEELKQFGISCFVAHDSIKITREWMRTIEQGLYSMNLFIALITDKFHESLWTNQEIGFAIGSNTPIISIRTKSISEKYNDPQGFYGKFQGMSFDGSKKFPSVQFIEVILESEQISDDLKEKVKNILIEALVCSPNYDFSTKVSELFPFFYSINGEQTTRLIEAYNSNKQVRECKKISGYDTYGRFYTSFKQVSKWLHEWTGKEYDLTTRKLSIKNDVNTEIPF